MAMASCSLFKPTPEPKRTLTFHEKRNCSPTAYEYINKRDEAREKKITLYEFNELQTRSVDFFLAKEKDLMSCYEETSQEYYVCAVVGVSSKAKVEFLDVADEVNKLDENIKNCLIKKLQSYDYKPLKAKYGTKFTMPLKFTAKK